jgi:hypothetical protein
MRLLRFFAAVGVLTALHGDKWVCSSSQTQGSVRKVAETAWSGAEKVSSLSILSIPLHHGGSLLEFVTWRDGQFAYSGWGGSF